MAPQPPPTSETPVPELPPETGRRRETPEERHARRVAWGKEAGRRVAEEYRKLTEAE